MYMKVKSLKKTLLLITIVLACFIYIVIRNFSSTTCSHLYNVNSFQECALSNEICNLTVLLHSYIRYRNCIIHHSPTDIDYVVFDAVNGLGNRILGLVAVTTYALVTSRMLLINWQPGDNHQTSFEDIFLPSPLSDNVPFYNRYSLSKLANLIKYKWMNEIEWNTKHSQIPTDWAFYFDRDIVCNEKTSIQSWFTHIGFYILNLVGHHVQWIRTDQYFVPLLKRNRVLKPAFTTLFRNGQVFSELAPILLLPVPKVKSIVENFLTEHNLEEKKTNTIGVHMRSWSSSTIDHIEPFQKCVEHVIKNITKSTNNETKIYLYVISNTRPRRQLLEKQISGMYKNIEILNILDISTNMSSIEQMQHTLAELVILSKMQHLILTSKSTFGMVAQGIGRKGAWIVRQGAPQESKDLKTDLCEWESTSEPEYQMTASLNFNDSCSPLPSTGERTIL